MAGMDLASSFPSSAGFDHQFCYKFTDYKHAAVVLRPASTEMPSTRKQKPNGEPRGGSINPNAHAHFRALMEAKELQQIHAHILKIGRHQNISFSTKLISRYALFGAMDNARLIFDKLDKPNVFLWNVMIRGYANKGLWSDALTLYYRMHQLCVQPDKFTFPFVLKACAGLSALQEGKEIHNHVVRFGFESDVYVGAALLDMYGKCGSLEDACQVFDKMSRRDVVSWSAMIAGYAQNGHADEALTLFRQMQLAGVKANSVTMVSVLQACAHLGSLPLGKLVHGSVIRSGFDSDVSVGNAMISMYARCRCVRDARQSFDKMSERHVVSWNAMIAGYAQNGHASEALKLLHQMQLTDIKPDSVTMVSVLQACAHLESVQQGKLVHGYVIRRGFELDVSVGNSLVALYAKCARIEIAEQLFAKMSRKDVVSWNAMIAGYAQNGQANEALTLFERMQVAHVTPDTATLVCVLQACAHLGALQQGKWIHDYMVQTGLEVDVFLGNSLIAMYAKCGSIELARQTFDKMSERDVITWSTMIGGYGMNGNGEDALVLFSQMQQTGLIPNDITFISVLSACSHAGLIDEGWEYFVCMSQEYGIEPRTEHYACMVDLLGRAGHLDEAHDFIKRMPVKPAAGVWGALLGACRIHGNIELGEHVAGNLFDLEPQNAGYYILLSNIYAAAGRWGDVAKVRIMMKERGLKKMPGCSWIEVNNKVHAFLVEDRSHPQSEKIYATLETLARQMEEAGYVPNTNFVLLNVEEEMKEHMVCNHSEKLAIAFGLININPGSPIRITKNLRVCGDCHNATKFISKIVRREIIVRDANRFHHFKDGLCSCGDYW